jgi:hypothetical protein
VGLLDRLRGVKRPPPGVTAKTADEVKAALHALNRSTAPFTVHECPEGKADVVAEWKICDATWYELFAKAGLEKIFKVLMKIDADKAEVRAVDQEWTVEWRGGVPRLSESVEAFRGQSKEIEFGQAYAYTETLESGPVYRYKFQTSELKGQLQDAVTGAGWTWRGVSFGKL